MQNKQSLRKHLSIESLVVRLGSIALLVVLLQMLPFGTISAIEYGGVGLKPANPDPAIERSDTIFFFDANRGDSIDDGVIITNNTDESRVFSVYSADYIPSSDGGLACTQLGEGNSKIGEWLVMSQSEITLGPKQAQTIPFKMNIPENIGSGEHNGCLFVQEVTANGNENDPGLNLSFRTGVRVVVIVDGEQNIEIELDNFSARTKDRDNLQARVSITNTGNVSATSYVDIKAYSMFGVYIGGNRGDYLVLLDEAKVLNLDIKRSFWGGIVKFDLESSYSREPGFQESDPVREDFSNKSVYIFVWPHPILLVGSFGLIIIGIFFYTKQKGFKFVTRKKIKMSFKL